MSVVAVPANPDALLATGLRSGMSVSRATIVSLLAKVMDGEEVEVDDDGETVEIINPRFAEAVADRIVNEILAAAGIDPRTDSKMLTFTVDDDDGGWTVEVAR